MNQCSHKYLMPEISSHQDKLALENSELLEEYAIDLDLNWLTSLKNLDEDSIEKINVNDTFTDSLDYKRYEFINVVDRELKHNLLTE